MTEEQNNLSNSAAADIDLESPGAMLASARQANNISLEQAAKELFVSVVKLQALEQDQFEQFNSPIFVRGYLRSYAKLLKINGDQVVAAFDALLAARAPKSTEAELRAMPENPQKQLRIFIAAIAGILFIIYMISIWFFDNGKETQLKSSAATSVTLAPSIDNLPAPEVAITNTASSAVSLSSVVSTNASVAAIAVSTNSLVKTESTSRASASSSRATTSSVAMSVSVASSRAPVVVQTVATNVQSSKPASVVVNNTAVKNQRLDEISFSFHEESWLEVSDSRGDVLATELQPAGSHLSLTGQSPFDVKLGNSPGVEVKINGKKYPITPLLTSKVLILKVAN